MIRKVNAYLIIIKTKHIKSKEFNTDASVHLAHQPYALNLSATEAFRLFGAKSLPELMLTYYRRNKLV